MARADAGATQVERSAAGSERVVIDAVVGQGDLMPERVCAMPGASQGLHAHHKRRVASHPHAAAHGSARVCDRNVRSRDTRETGDRNRNTQAQEFSSFMGFSSPGCSRSQCVVVRLQWSHWRDWSTGSELRFTARSPFVCECCGTLGPTGPRRVCREEETRLGRADHVRIAAGGRRCVCW